MARRAFLLAREASPLAREVFPMAREVSLLAREVVPVARKGSLTAREVKLLAREVCPMAREVSLRAREVSPMARETFVFLGKMVFAGNPLKSPPRRADPFFNAWPHERMNLLACDLYSRFRRAPL
jgi:hypothetical protein